MLILKLCKHKQSLYCAVDSDAPTPALTIDYIQLHPITFNYSQHQSTTVNAVARCSAHFLDDS